MANVIGVGTRLATAGATLAALNSGYGLVGLCVVNAAGDLLGYTLRWRVAYRILPELRISPRMAARQHLWAIMTFGLWSLLAQGAVQLKSYSSSLVIGIFLPVAAITPYALAVGLLAQFEGIFRPVAVVFFPAATELDARGDTAGLRRMYLVGSKMLMLLATCLGAIGAIWAEDFFRLWVGPRLVEGREYTSVAALFWVLLGAVIVAIAQKIGLQVFMASRRLKGLTLVLLAEALANLALTISLIRPFGLLGVALGTLFPAILCQGVLQPAMLCRLLRVPSRAYLRQVYLRPLAVGSILFPLLGLLHYALPAGDSWGALLCEGLIAIGAAGVFVVAIGLDGQERQRLIGAPVIRLLCRLGFRRPLDARVHRL
jgi:O-antigen/teichoic acid export membrane protein